MMRVGRQIFVRTTALYASFSSLRRCWRGWGRAAGRTDRLPAFVFLALVLDAVAVAGQVVVGRLLGAGDAESAFARPHA